MIIISNYFYLFVLLAYFLFVLFYFVFILFLIAEIAIFWIPKEKQNQTRKTINWY